MLVTEKRQVTIPKHIRTAAGVTPGSEVASAPTRSCSSSGATSPRKAPVRRGRR
ncbi:AbrB/MazE/SpoVT family DNA-binding domain-containing protein [Pseudorhodoferax sp. Leaf267]|uniref:AbrB/MazE/SpoVT family DNA-binding domain-containing protein n=1 Tax=Pseudorhodoferax sp. Leaf267 TaxID=1736316 RepID=UPI00350EDD6B